MTTSVSVPAAKLREMLAAVIPHAGDEDSLPLLNAVQFEVRAGTLFLIATDRYTIAIARCVIPGADAAPVQYAAANLMLAEAREMHHILERSDAVAALAFGDDDLRLDTGAGGSASWTLTPGADYPDWRDLMRDMLAGEPAQLGGKRMFRYVVPVDDQAHEFTLTGDPVAVAIGDHGNLSWAVEFWAEHVDLPGSVRAFRVFGTGHPLPPDARWVGTCPRTSGLAMHLYEVTP